MNCLVDCLKTMFVNHYPKVFVSQTIFWLVASVIKNPTLVDVAWGANHMVLGYSIFSSVGLMKNNYLAAALLSLWFLRLSGFIFYNRIWKRHVDPRYEDLRRNKNEILYYLFQFHLQGILCVFTAIPLYFVFQITSLNPFNIVGLGLCVAGIVGETIADQQLQAHKNQRTISTEVFRRGLFEHSRHPNLFFELVFWSGMAFLGLNPANACSFVSFLGPALLYVIMKYLTIPVTTKHMKKTKPNYNEVIAHTHTFWPFTAKNSRL